MFLKIAIKFAHFHTEGYCSMLISAVTRVNKGKTEGAIQKTLFRNKDGRGNSFAQVLSQGLFQEDKEHQ